MRKREILTDAAKRLLEDGVAPEDVVESLTDAGMPQGEAVEIVTGMRAGDDIREKGAHGRDENEAREKEGKSPGKAQAQTRGRKGKGILGGLFGGIIHPKDELADIRERVVSSGAVQAEHPAQKEHAGIRIGAQGAEEGLARQSPLREKAKFRETMPLRVSDFDKLIDRGGLKRGDTIMLSGGCGTGKTTFAMQSLYNAALHGERGVYITLEESVEKMKENMLQNFGWDLYRLEEEGKLAIIKQDPLSVARSVEAMMEEERGGLYIDSEDVKLPFRLNLPFRPDRVVVDSLSALGIAFMENEQAYRQYLRYLFETLEKYNSVNIVLGETEQEPSAYSRSGIEEFLADGVIVFYNLRIHNIREKALEILKLRSSNHDKRIIPYKITEHGIRVYTDQELFR